MTAPFGARLATAMDAYGPLCVGIDPHTSLLEAWGLPDDASGVRSFALTVMDAVGGRVAAVKPQAAFFEQLGPAGMVVLKSVIDYAAAKGLLVILDGKRNDIGSTAQGYAEGYLGAGTASAWGCDALTVSPYLGDDSLTP